MPRPLLTVLPGGQFHCQLMVFAPGGVPLIEGDQECQTAKCSSCGVHLTCQVGMPPTLKSCTSSICTIRTVSPKSGAATSTSCPRPAGPGQIGRASCRERV